VCLCSITLRYFGAGAICHSFSDVVLDRGQRPDLHSCSFTFGKTLGYDEDTVHKICLNVMVKRKKNPSSELTPIFQEVVIHTTD
jgi:hypothetical protein